MELTDKDLPALFAEVSNWGRWGADDEAGTVNLIGPAERIRALSSVTDGVLISCSRDIEKTVSEHNLNPAVWSLIQGGDVAPTTGAGVTTDRLMIAPHGGTFTHLDALCHVSFDGQTYNGRPVSLVASNGIGANDLSAMLDGVVGRGVLIDIPALRGVDFIPVDDPIRIEELYAAEREFGITVEPGDIVAVNVGRDARVRVEGVGCERVDGRTTLAGMTPECLRWLRQRDVGVLIGEGGHDFLPRKGAYAPIHVGALVYMGLPLVDNATFERLIGYARQTNRWSFAFTLVPLRCFGTTGAAINPIAIF